MMFARYRGRFLESACPLGDATDEVNGRDALPMSAIEASSAVPGTELDGSF